MDVWTIHWRYHDGSDCGVIPRAFTTMGDASWLLDLLRDLDYSRVYTLHGMKAVSAFSPSPAAADAETIADMELSIRAHNVLKTAGLLTVGDIRKLSNKDLRALKGMGVRSFREIREVLDGR